MTYFQKGVELGGFSLKNLELEMQKKFPAPKAAKMKWVHELRVGCHKLKPCDGFDRVQGERCLVVKGKESETTCIADEIIRTLKK